MYKWISVVAIGSNIFSNKKLNLLWTNSNVSSRLDMTTSVSAMNVISYDYDWMPNVLYNDEFDIAQACTSFNQLETHHDANSQSPNHKLDITQINNQINQYYLLTNEMPVIETMNEFDFDNCDNAEEGGQWKEKIKKHRKSSNFGFSSLQKRIERVKNDIINLTNKLNTGYVENGDDMFDRGDNTYYNLGFGNMTDGEFYIADEDSKSEAIEPIFDKKTWKCPSQFTANNPYAELSENTQKILNRLHLNEEPISNQLDKDVDDLAIIDDNLEMEEDDIEFTFCTTQNGLLQNFLNRGTLPIIVEEDELVSSSEDDTDSVRSTIIDNFTMDIEALQTPTSMSMESVEFTESESFKTAFTNPALASQMEMDKNSFDEAGENLSDYARYSMSSHSSKESLNSFKIERIDNESGTDRTLINHNESNNKTQTIETATQDLSSSSQKFNDGTDSDAEYDASTWSNEDVLQSVEQSDSLYEKPIKPTIKSSLPDLIESSDNIDLNGRNSFYGNRNLNKSTDLDEIILQQRSPCPPSNMNRLSMSLCNLNSPKQDNRIYPSKFFQETSSQSNLLETDLDSGFVSIYQPIRETEILPSVDFSVSMCNIPQEKSSTAFNSLYERLKSRAGSIPELRIADSLNKLNVPEWLNFRQDEPEEMQSNSKNPYATFSSHSFDLPHTISSHSSSRLLSSLPRLQRQVTEPPIKPQLMAPVILPSQKLRQSSQRKLTPIKSCRARELLLPNKVGVGIS